MPYKRTYWKDHVEDQYGNVVQQGTLQDQAHFNNAEEGISDSDTAIRVLVEGYLDLRRTQELHGEEITGGDPCGHADKQQELSV